MKIGRNDSCPCGSGKKYMSCCGLKTGFWDIPDDNRDDKDENGKDINESMFLMMNSFHRYLLAKKEHIKEYYKIRKLHGEIINSMVDYYYDGKFEQKCDPDFKSPEAHDMKGKKPKQTLLLSEIKFDMDTEEGAQAFYDLIFYKNAPNINCITEDFIDNHRYRKPEKIEFLQSMLDSRLGLYEVTGKEIGEGYVYLKEVFTDRECKIVDTGVSCNPAAEDCYYYARILSYKGVGFFGGLNLVFRKTDRFIINFIRQNRKDYSPNGEFMRFMNLFKQYSNDPNGLKLTVNKI